MAPTSPITGSSQRLAIVAFDYDFFQNLSPNAAQRPALTNFGGDVITCRARSFTAAHRALHIPVQTFALGRADSDKGNVMDFPQPVTGHRPDGLPCQASVAGTILQKMRNFGQLCK